jgi:kynurenine 3-monooxygenase
MVPFYGQGMNAGMEDVRILFSILDKHVKRSEDNNPVSEAHNSSSIPTSTRAEALAEYSELRAPDAYAINELALQNYVEMRSSVLSMRYRLRKFLEEFMSVNFPNFGWNTKYSRVSFSNQSYGDVVRQSDHQGRILMRAFIACATSPVAVAIIILGYRYRKSFLSTATGILGLN